MQTNKLLLSLTFMLLFTSIASQEDAQNSEDACECEDVAPPTEDDFNCTAQALWEKCNEDWMIGYCQCSCGTCGIVPAAEEHHVVAVQTEVAPGEPIEVGICQERDEPRNCAFSRKRCCDGCASEDDVDFDCKQSGNSFASSCSCASRGGFARGRAFSRSSLFPFSRS
eukprot:TRINITY_DN9688_c0_g1_i2.p4 TRINITY_DN9688_c0_g1~~TRINITY_DN9688_c0_g1_i2.p4  ORF type:complete len:168 (-),score=29.25 TRINITY_DN9688_c0_g1_i2:307-810(-)